MPTINGACNGISDTHGSITIGKNKLYYHETNPSYYQLPYAFGSNLIDSVFLGRIII
jgi:imidazolonepropionase